MKDSAGWSTLDGMALMDCMVTRLSRLSYKHLREREWGRGPSNIASRIGCSVVSDFGAHQFHSSTVMNVVWSPYQLKIYLLNSHWMWFSPKGNQGIHWPLTMVLSIPNVPFAMELQHVRPIPWIHSTILHGISCGSLMR